MQINNLIDKQGTMSFFISDGNIPGDMKAVVLYHHTNVAVGSRVFCSTCCKVSCSHIFFIHEVLEEEDEAITAMYIDDMCETKVPPEFVKNMKLEFQRAVGGYKKRSKRRKPDLVAVIGKMQSSSTKEPTKAEMQRRKRLLNEALALLDEAAAKKAKPTTRFGDLEI
jgi:hypothetical protein